MKVISGFLVGCVFSGPTRPAGSDIDFVCPTECVHLVTLKKLNRGPRPDYEDCDIDQLAEKCQADSKMEEYKCPTECDELKDYENALYKGVRPDYDYGCDIEGLVEKCQNQGCESCENDRIFPDYMYDLPEADPEFDDLTLSKLKNEVCAQFPNVCCPLMVAQGGFQRDVFSEATLSLLDDEKARKTCNVGRNRACCVEGDLCKAYPDLPHCLTPDISTTATPDASTETPVTEQEIGLDLGSKSEENEQTTTTVETTTVQATSKQRTTEKATTKATTTIAPSNAPIMADGNLGNGNGDANGDSKNEEENGEHDEQHSSANWWIVAALLLGIGVLVLGVVLAKKFSSRPASGYAEARLIATQEKSSLENGEEQQQQQQQQQEQQQQS